MIKAILIDDEMSGIKSLELLIKKFVPEIKLLGLTNNPTEGIDLINKNKPDLVFLDINMPGLNGFELLDELAYKDFKLIFTTAYQEYAIRAIKVAAIDYLLKPIDIEDLRAAVQKVKQKLTESPSTENVQELLSKIINLKSIRIPLPHKNGIDYVSPSAIVYIEAKSNEALAVLTNQTKVEVTKPLKEYESLLCQEGFYFMRVHNSFIINLNYVNQYFKEMGGYVVMQNNQKIPISKQKKLEFLTVFKLHN